MSEPQWKACCRDCSAVDVGDVQIASFHISEEISDEQMREYKERAIACVNGCRGLNPEHLGELVETLRRVSDWLDENGNARFAQLLGVNAALEKIHR